MLTITRPAASMLLASREEEGIPADTSLRVSSSASADGDRPSLTIGFVDQPLDGDQVGVVHGLSICVAPDVAEALDSAAIDVAEHDGHRHLVVIPGRM